MLVQAILCVIALVLFFFQAEDGIRDEYGLVGSEMCIRDRVEGVDQHQRPADEVERLVARAVAGQAAGGDEGVGEEKGGRA